MASILNEPCPCPRRLKATCRHKTWRVRYRDPEGKQREQSFKTREDADGFATKIERDKDLGSYINPRQAKRPFSSIWDDWRNAGTLEPGTYANYDSVYRNHFEDFFGGKPIGSVTSEDIVKWEKAQKARGYKDYGIQVRRSILASVFKYAVDAEIIGRNPCRRANPRKNEGKSAYAPVADDEIPETHEVLEIISQAPKALRAALWAMAGCGVRPGEALAISDKSIDWESAVLLVDHQVTAHGVSEVTGQKRGVKRGTKHRVGSEARRTPIPGPIAETFNDHIDSFGLWGDQGWLFESPRRPEKHPSYEWLLDNFRASVESAGLPHYTPKSFRHYFVSECLHAGIPLYEIAQWVGHRDTRTTEMVYGHLRTRSFKRGADTLGERIAGDLSTFRGKIEPPHLVPLAA